MFFGYWASRPTNIEVSIVKLSGDVGEDATTLRQKGLVRSPLVFKYYWRQQHANIEPGYYSLTGSSLKELAQAIVAGPNTNRITFPEGFSVGQVAQRLNKYGMDGDGFYAKAKSMEGQLFPDTYYFDKKASTTEIIEKMNADYKTRIANMDVTEKVLIVASIVEREAKKDEDRAQIAAVNFNRLEIGMNLEADPTVQYGRDLQLIASQGLDETELWQPLKPGETKSISSAYNTYVNGGLPPGPICNPGLKSIQAAVNPTPDFDKTFFFHDKNGDIHFSNSLEEHQALIKQFGL